MTPTPTSEKARAQFVALLRQFYRGRITNDEFEDATLPLMYSDHAVAEIFKFSARGSYSDTHEYRLVGRNALSRENKRVVARWILFLKSDRSYLWPDWPDLSKKIWIVVLSVAVLLGSIWHGCVGAWLTFVGFAWLLAYGENFYGRKKWEKLATAEDRGVWPFISKADYETALRNPPYFRGIDRRS